MPKRSRSPSPPPSSTALRASSLDPEAAHTPKYHRASLSPDPDTPTSSTGTDRAPHAMQCTLPPHAPLTLPSAAAFDAHYAKEHTNRCSACRANLPSARLLELHLAERHDPLVAARREKDQKTYACFVEGCEKVCAAPQKRRLHLIDKHGFPRNYYFRVVETGLDKRTTLLKGSAGGTAPESGGRRRRVSDVGAAGWQESARERKGTMGPRSRRGTLESGRANGNSSKVEAHDSRSDDGVQEDDEEPETMDVERKPSTNGDVGTSTGKQRPDQDMDDLTSSVAALKFVPLSVRLKARKSAT